MTRILMAIAMAAAVPGWALADEVWFGERGDRLEYAADIDGYAVLRSSDNTVYYIDGLAGNYANRTGVFTGQWVRLDRGASLHGQSCRATYTTIDGHAAAVHGPISIRFDSPAFPSGFELAREFCEGPVDSQGQPLERVITFHYFAPLTSAPSYEDETDYGYNDPRPGRNQEQECLERLAVYSGATDFSDLGGGQNRASQTWLISGVATMRSGYQRRFECYHVGGRVDRIVFGEGW